MTKLNELHWPLIIGMGAFALIRPLLSITGTLDSLGRPFGPLLVTGLISLLWLVIVVFGKVRYPLLTLICTGVAYGIFAILLSAILSPMLTGTLSGPITNPFALVAVLITNAIWGGMVGLLGLVMRKSAGNL